MSLDVKLQVFEGPLDLLLHLIEKNKIDIYDIPIVEVTEQYLEYVRRLEHEDMELTSEFMLMAATLIDIKCRMLLPSDSSEEEEEEDPREELVQQLIAYKEYKAKAGLLRERMEDTGELVSRSCDIPQEIKSFRPPVDTEELLEGVSLDRLHEIFSFVLRRQEEKVDPIRSKFGVIEKEQISFPDKLDYVEICARRKRRISFRRLLENQKGRMQVVVTFLAVLELMKIGKIKAVQTQAFGDIELESLEDVHETTLAGDSYRQDESETY